MFDRTQLSAVGKSMLQDCHMTVDLHTGDKPYEM